MQRKLRWGVLSTAKIALTKVVPGMREAPNLEVVAIASRDAARARDAAARLHLPHAFGSYEEMLASPEIDVVYNALPNHLHVPWTIRALEAGKHVLCEKPIGLTADEARELARAAAAHAPLKVMEAFMYRFHPQWRMAKRLVEEGELGRLGTIHSHFAYMKLDPSNIRNQKEAGGGGLMDIGCYDISLSRFLFDGEPERVVAVIDEDPRFGVDRLVSAILDFGDGRTATFTCATQLEPYQRVHAYGTEGRIELEIPFNAPQAGTCRLWHGRGTETVESAFPAADQYALQGEVFSDAVLNDAPVPTPLTDAIANMEVIDALRASADGGGWVSLGGRG